MDNYKQIMRIMTTSYIRSDVAEKKFRDRRGENASGDIDADPEYAAFKEEKSNTQKMSQILKSV